MNLSKDEFDSLEKYIVVNGDNINGDRCFLLLLDEKEITMCMNEYAKAAVICQVDGENIEIGQDLYVQKLLELADGIKYNTEDEEKYEYYLEFTKMECDCCEYCKKICTNNKNTIQKL